jgi:small subunit ribosomal protein S20
MAITSSAKKALRSSKRKAVYNAIRKDAIKNITKKIKRLVTEGNIKEAKALIPQAQKALDKAVKTNLIKANAASRKKSRLSAFVKKADLKK